MVETVEILKWIIDRWRGESPQLRIAEQLTEIRRVSIIAEVGRVGEV
jgi:hypothetical protein